MKRVSLSDHFTYKKIFQIVIGPILRRIFSSFYSVVDGIFLSNYAGDGAFSRVNLRIYWRTPCRFKSCPGHHD